MGDDGDGPGPIRWWLVIGLVVVVVLACLLAGRLGLSLPPTGSHP